MSIAACSLLVVAALSTGSATPSSTPSADPVPAVNLVADLNLDLQMPLSVQSSAPWVAPYESRRPAALPALYASLAALQVMDIYSTQKALGAGATEANPLVRPAATRAGAMLAVKAVSTATSIYFTERAWKKNRKGAVILMAVINGVTAAVVAHNMRVGKE